MSKTLTPVIPKLIFKKTIGSILPILISLGLGIALLLRKEEINRSISQQYPAFSTIISIPTIVASVMFLIAFLILISYILKVISYKSITYTLSKTFVKREKKLFAYQKTTIPLEQVTNIQYTRTWIVDKLFGTGDIFLHTAGSASYDIKLDAVKGPQKIYDYINKLLGYGTSEKINEKGEIATKKPSKLQKRLKPIPIIPTLGVLVGAPFILVISGGVAGLVSLITSLFSSSNALTVIIGVGILIGILLIWIISILITYKSYKRRFYDFYKDKIEFYDGFLTKRKATVATERITNVDNSQGIFGRLFNFHTITIETAGSSGAEITISYIRDGDKIVEELKEVLQEHGRN